MTTLEQLEQKIRNAIPELKEEFEAFEDSSINRDMITPIMLNHVLEYCSTKSYIFHICCDGLIEYNTGLSWNLKSAYLKDQSEELINFLNDLK